MTSSRPGGAGVIVFLRQRRFADVLKHGVFFIEMAPEEQTESLRVLNELRASPAIQRVIDDVQEVSLFVVFRSKRFDKLEDARRIGDLDAFALFQLANHPVENIQRTSKDGVILHYKLHTLHPSFPPPMSKKNATEQPHAIKRVPGRHGPSV